MDSHFLLIQTFFNFIDLKKNENNNKVQKKSLAGLARAGAASGGEAGVCCRCGGSGGAPCPGDACACFAPSPSCSIRPCLCWQASRGRHQKRERDLQMS